MVARQAALRIGDDLRKPIDRERSDLIAHAYLRLHRDEDVCKHIVRTDYNSQLDARKIQDAVREKIRIESDKQWRSRDTEIAEWMNQEDLACWMVHLIRDASGEDAIDVFEKGVEDGSAQFAHG
ncbi:MAG: hypothetical protein ACRYGR_09135 [Janthinobacterium lividum]